MLVGGLLKLRIGGEDITVRGEVALNSLKNTANFNRIGISLREVKPHPENLLRARDRLTELTGDDILPLEEEISKTVVKHFPDLQQEYAPLAVQLRSLNLPGVDRVEAIQESITELLKGDASDAANRLGGPECPLFDDLIWVREVKKAFDNQIEAVIKKANTYVREIPLLPAAGIPGEVITATAPIRELLTEYLGRNDFYHCQPEINRSIFDLEKVIKGKTAALKEEQQGELQAAKEAIKTSAEWQQLGAADQARFAGELDSLEIGAAEDLAGFKKLLNDKYALDMRLGQIRKEIQKILDDIKGPDVLEKDLSFFPQFITSLDQLEAIITELESLKTELPKYDKIILKWK